MPRTKNPNGKCRLVVLNAYRADPSASLQELVRVTGYSQTAVYYHLRNLRDTGVIVRENMPRGRRAGFQQKKTVNKSQKIDQRKYNSKETIEKKRDAMVRTMDKNFGNAFVAKSTKEKDAEHFDAAVALGKANDAKAKFTRENAVLYDHLSLFASGRVRGSKVS